MKMTTLPTVAVICLVHALPSYTQNCSTQTDVEFTYFGYPDNSPPGPGISFSCGRRGLIAGGSLSQRKQIGFPEAYAWSRKRNLQRLRHFCNCCRWRFPGLRNNLSAIFQKYARYESDGNQRGKCFIQQDKPIQTLDKIDFFWC